MAYFIAYRLLICFWFIFRPSVRGVFVGLWYDSKILIIKNSYKTKYSVPGGYLKRSENPTLAAARELEEEINVRLPADRLKFVGEYTFFDEFKHDTVFFFETILTDFPEIRIDNREVIWARFLTSSAALEFNLTSAVRDYLEEIENRGVG